MFWRLCELDFGIFRVLSCMCTSCQERLRLPSERKKVNHHNTSIFRKENFAIHQTEQLDGCKFVSITPYVRLLTFVGVWIFPWIHKFARAVLQKSRANREDKSWYLEFSLRMQSTSSWKRSSKTLRNLKIEIQIIQGKCIRDWISILSNVTTAPSIPDRNLLSVIVSNVYCRL